MSSLAPAPLRLAPPLAPTRLAARVREVLARPWRGGVQRVSVDLEPLDPLPWLRAQADPVKFYWHGRHEAVRVAALGVADVVAGEAATVRPALQARLDALAHLPGAPALRYFGGLRFDPAQPGAPEWRGFGAARFVLPRLVLETGPERATLTCLLRPDDAAHPEPVWSALRALVFPSFPTTPDLPQPLARVDRPDLESWTEMVEAALSAFETTDLKKVVLARRARYEFDAPLDPLVLIERLEAATPNCFHLCFLPGDGSAFVSATPERLFRRDGDRVESEAVAGTRPRAASKWDDDRLQAELLSSEKDQREHGYVRDALLDALRPFTTALQIDAHASALTLASKHHLRSGVQGVLRPDIRPLDVLAALHPTPAVGGTPTLDARTFIRTHEAFDRGWYAGPVGWVGPQDADFAVGIRSGLVQGNTLALYSGAGIVAGSQPAEEWAEIEHKLSDFARVLGLSVRM